MHKKKQSKQGSKKRTHQAKVDSSRKGDGSKVKKTKDLTIKQILELYDPSPSASSSFSRSEVF
ncbi:MAG: hypothetical protein RTV72_12865 [Candidatus Thorarchaeota archaeon]